jgi:2-oxoisovalerate dehydrogenase E1 component
MDLQKFESYDLDNQIYRSLYFQLKYPRLIEEKMLLLIRQGKVSKWFSGIGQEAISVGCSAALNKDEMIFTMHRNLGVFTTREVPLKKMMLQWQGKKDGFTKGRDRSFHFGAKDYGIIGMISHLGPQLSLAAGVALAYKQRSQKKVSLAFTGEGATSQGEFHEALNTASVWQLPVIFVIENNGYGLSTPTNEQYRCERLADRAIGYGIEGITIDGNNILEVYTTVKKYAESLRENPRPILIECITFRMRGHEEASGVKYVPPTDLELWAKKDPVDSFEAYLLSKGILTSEEIEQYTIDTKQTINQNYTEAENTPALLPNVSEEINDVFAPTKPKPEQERPMIPAVRYVDAISQGLDEAMQANTELILMGQDIGHYGGVFKITDGFVAKYGSNRVRNTPLCESAIVGIACGLSIEGIPSMVEMQFGDFVSCAFNQIVNNLAKLHYRWGQNANVVIRMPAGGGVGAGPFHSQTNEAWFTHTAGLKVVYPSNSYDAKGLLISALEDGNPVIYFEHKALYRTHESEVMQGHYHVPIGEAKMVQDGSDLCIITYGMGVHWATEVVKNHPDHSIAILDLRTLVPLDTSYIDAVVKKTNKVIVLQEANHTAGFGAEVASYISENLFEFLDGPVARVSSLDTPIPFSTVLENQYLPKTRLDEAIEKLLHF